MTTAAPWLLASISLLGGLCFGYTQVGLNNGVGVLWACWYDLSTESASDLWRMAILQSIVNIGAAIGAFSGSKLMDKIGRKKAIMIAGALSCATFASCFAANYFAQMAIRTVVGLGIGLASTVCNAYVAEMSPKHLRGGLGSLFQVAITFGIVVATVLAYFILGSMRDEKTEYYCDHHHKSDIMKKNILITALGGIPSVLLTVIAFVIPESVAFDNVSNTSMTTKLRAGEGSPLVKYDGEYSLTKPIKPLVTAIVLSITLQLTGINAVMYYTSNFFDTAHVKQKFLGSVGVMVWNFVTTLVALALADKANRRTLFLPATAAVSVSILLMAPFFTYIHSDTAKAVIIFILLAIYIAGFEIGPGCLFWVLGNEIFPENVSGQGMAVMNALQWTLTVAVTMAFRPLNSAMGPSVFYLFGIPGVLCTLYLFFCMPETRGKSKQEVTDEMASGWLIRRDAVGYSEITPIA